jgi:hypothetical protein
MSHLGLAMGPVEDPVVALLEAYEDSVDGNGGLTRSSESTGVAMNMSNLLGLRKR